MSLTSSTISIIYLVHEAHGRVVVYGRCANGCVFNFYLVTRVMLEVLGYWENYEGTLWAHCLEAYLGQEPNTLGLMLDTT